MTFRGNGQRVRSVQDLARSTVEIPTAEQWIMTSSGEQRRYQIMISKPASPPPPAGYPVIYVLDANSVFGTMVEAVRLQSRRPDTTGVVPAIIVGIGYETREPFSPHRYYDFTPMATAEYHKKPDGTPIPEQGGAAAFLQFIEEDLKPEIEQEFAIDTGKQAIFGHSLGGLFALYVLFNRPESFQCYIAGSPSIHWNWKYLEEAEEQFLTELEQKNKQGTVKILFGVGELEKQHVSGNSDRAREMSRRLSSRSVRGVTVEFKEFEGEGHVSVLPALISRALRFALD
ncbi:Ferri-bacillibactin esterase BesA [compost metagenome]